MQISIFDGTKPFKIIKPIRLITLFSGYDSQALSLKYLGIPFEHYHTCEWAIPSIQALKDLHFDNDNSDYSVCLSKADLVDILYAKGVSSDYNKPLTKEQLSRYSETKLRTIYNNIIATKNLVSICNINGKDLEICNTDKYEYIMTYSFPCQDLSSAGKGAGMGKGSGTRSGLLWEVERLLDECEELPQVLLMENVPEVIGSKNIKHFAKWVDFLDKLGYRSKWGLLNAKDFGIAQNRNRCFMVSVLDDYYYDMPTGFKLEYFLKDFLDKKVDEIEPITEYELSDKMKKYINSYDDKYKVSDNNLVVNKVVAGAVTTREGSSRADASSYISKDLPENTNIAGKDMTRYRVRKLTERECFKLMGVKQEDFEKIRENQSKSSCYHLAGDSIVTTVLMAIFGQMFDVDWKTKIDELVEELTNERKSKRD